jgi:flagellar M-ring protein FliF
MTAGLAAGAEGEVVAAGGPGGGAGGAMTGTLSGPGGDAAALTGPGGEELMMLANVEGALRASSVRKISALVDSHPQESLALLRNWFVEETE